MASEKRYWSLDIEKESGGPKRCVAQVPHNFFLVIDRDICNKFLCLFDFRLVTRIEKKVDG